MCPIASGNWNNGEAAGVWALNLNGVRANSNNNVGFRADSIPHGQQCRSGIKGDGFRRVACPRRNLQSRRLFGRATEDQAVAS